MPQASGRTILFEIAEGLAPLPQAVVFQFKALERLNPPRRGYFPPISDRRNHQAPGGRIAGSALLRWTVLASQDWFQKCRWTGGKLMKYVVAREEFLTH